MSYIDTFAHKPVGVLAGLPVYHPHVERKAPRGTYDFGCTPQNLVLGGGSGEHPALVVHCFDELVAAYLLHRLDGVVLEGQSQSLEALQDRLLARCSYQFDRYFEFCGWGLEQTAALLPRLQAPSNGTPWVPGHESAEHWLAHSFGEFCWYSMPELAGGYAETLRHDFPELATRFAGPKLTNLKAWDESALR